MITTSAAGDRAHGTWNTATAKTTSKVICASAVSDWPLIVPSRKVERETGVVSRRRSVPLLRYGDLVAVDGISFEAPAGEVFGLLGPNGAGKTSTLGWLEEIRFPEAPCR